MPPWPPEPGDEGLTPDNIRFIFPTSSDSWRAWLGAHSEDDPAARPGVWLVLPKRGADIPGVTLEHAIDDAICFGWVDSLPTPLDALRWSIWFTPRLPATPWSKRSKQRAQTLIAEGRMAEPGLHTIVIAQKAGVWNRLDRDDSLDLPGDLVLRLNRNAKARTGWLGLSAAEQRSIAIWITNATREGTRQERIRRTIEAAKAGRAPQMPLAEDGL